MIRFLATRIPLLYICPYVLLLTSLSFFFFKLSFKPLLEPHAAFVSVYDFSPQCW